MVPEMEGLTAVRCCGRILPWRVISFWAVAMAAAVAAGLGTGAGCLRPRQTTTPTARANRTTPDRTGIHFPRISLKSLV